MKLRSICTLLICFLTLSSFAQDIKQDIAREFTEYQNAIINKEFERSLDYIIPEFFEIYPKNEVLSLMEKTFNDPSMSYEIKNTEINEVEDIKNIEDKFYALLTYSSQMNIQFAGDENESEADKKSRTSMTRIYLEQSFGSNNVSYNPSTDHFEVKAQKQVYAISENGKTGWKFLMVEKEQKQIMDRILPAELASKI